MSWREELYHHGIKGQRWGVRRYQNADGSLTPYGKKRISKIHKKYGSAYAMRHISGKTDRIKTAGVEVGKQYDVIKKGTTLGRFSSSEKEAIDSKRKYAFVTDDDRYEYLMWAKTGNLGFKAGNFYEYKLTAKKDLKVAKGEDIVNFLLDRYSDYIPKETIRDYNTFKEVQQMAPGLGIGNITNKKDQEFYKNAVKGRMAVNRIVNSALCKENDLSSTVMDHFKKLGYDAVVDAEDTSVTKLGGMDYPVILLDPKSSIKLKSVERYDS